MNGRTPPVIATWLLEHLATGYHAQALAGDLIEQYARGRSRLWYWREVIIAISLARARSFRSHTRLWITARRLVCHVAIELAVVLGAVVIIDGFRIAHHPAEMLTPAFVGTMALLMAVGSVGYVLLRRTRRAGARHARVDRLIMLFAVAALGAGTLTWADTVRRQARAAGNCPCATTELPTNP
jgi:hypothetical protein